jgi:hypothetical protein
MEQQKQSIAQQSAELQIIERKSAKILGLNHYYTGMLCVNGHLSKRMTSNGVCMECHRLRGLSARKENPDATKIAWKKYYSTEKGRKKSNECSKRYRLNPKNKEKIAKSKYASKDKNRNLYNAISKTYSKRVKSRIPSWQPAREIKEYYMESRNLGLEVDHIVPITSSVVCGLHCIDNFQMLTREDNASKGNRHWPDMP